MADTLGIRSASLNDLSRVEREVLLLMSDGLRNRAIAQKLHKSEKTVEKQVARIFSKLELHDPALDRRVLAVRIVLGWGDPTTALALILTGG
jgi:DNA-binding NarL/FixJ family response regulator